MLKKNYMFDISFVFVFAIFLSYAASSRLFGIGPDYLAYVTIFGENTEKTEPAFMLLRRINQFFFKNNINVLFFAVAYIALILKLQFYMRYSKNHMLSIFIYCFTIFFLHEYTQIRAALATGICFLTFDDIKNRNFKKFLPKILFAILFHYSSVLMIFAYFYCGIFKRPRTYLRLLWLMFILGTIISILLRGQTLFSLIVPPDFLFLCNVGDLKSINDCNWYNMFYLLILFGNTLYYKLYNGFKNSSSKDILVYKLSILSPLLYYFCMNFGFHVLTYRFSEFFVPYFFLVIPAIVCRFKEKFFALLFVSLIVAYYCRALCRAAL